MPYPPPPGPPSVGFFQGIGKLIAPTLPDVTGHASEFLETDGVIPQWEPVTGVLPPQGGHAGEFLTTDGATASWSAVAPGGLTTVGAITTPTADAATVTGGNTLHLAVADDTNPGITSIVAQSFAGAKKFLSGAATLRFDVTLFGAVPDDPTFDSYPAFIAAINAWTQSNAFSGITKVGYVYVPQGTYYLSQPLLTPQGCVLKGDGKFLSWIAVGPGTPSTPSLVQGWGGPLMFVTGPISKLAYPGAYPQYSTSLATGPGQSMVMDPLNPTTPTPAVFLGDCNPWTAFFDGSPTALSLEGFINITASGDFNPIVGSIGPYGWSARYYNGANDTALLIYTANQGGIKVGARITTSDQQQLQILSGVLGAGTHHIEVDFGGGNFDLYVDGTRIDRLVATGTILRRPWESAMLAGGGTVDWVGPFSCPTGKVDGIRLSNAVRHTANFTPPTAKPTWDANTLWLCNFDQGDAPDGNQPFFLAQTSTFGNLNPMTHYCRLNPPTVFGFFPAPYQQISDIGLNCNHSCAGLLVHASFISTFTGIKVINACNWGFRLLDGFSFYSQAKDINVENCYGIGAAMAGDMEWAITVNCGIGYLSTGGRSHGVQDQPTFSTFMSFVFAYINGQYDSGMVTGCSVDEESSGYVNQRAAALFWIGDSASLVSKNNTWDVSQGVVGVARAVVLLNGTGYTTFEGDGFFQNPVTQQPYAFEWAADQPPARRVTVKNCRRPFNNGNLDWSVRDDLVATEDEGSNAGVVGLSTSVVPANNLAGQLYVTHGFTTGVAVFPVYETDTDYIPVVTLEGYSGSAPAANSTTILSYSKLTTGFSITTAADPGGTCQLVYNWHIIRVPLPVYFSPEPALPSNFANPLDGQTDVDFAVGFTLVPVGSNSFLLNSSLSNEQAITSGTNPGPTGWESHIINGGALLNWEIAGAGSQIDAFVSPVHHRMRSMVSPGSHQVAFVSSSRTVNIYVDGEPSDGVFVATFGPQAATIYVGETSGATDPLVSATVRNLKIGKNLAEVTSGEPDVGPLAMPQYAIFGDDMTLGLGATLGSFASQIASARYGTNYYWIAAKISGRYLSAGGYGSGILPYFWVGWAEQAGLTGICLFSGLYDVVTDQPAADIWGAIQSIVEGGPASSTFTPNVQNTFAWAHLYPANQPGINGTFTLAGVPFTVMGNGLTPADSLANSNTLKGLIDANGTTNVLVDTDVEFDPAQPNGGRYFVNVLAKVPGSAGTAITLTYDLGGGELLWSGPGTTGVSLASVPDSTITITPSGGSPVTLLANFDTDADTTVNNIITLFNAEPTLTAVAAASLVNHQLFVQATTPGAAGNLIAVTNNQVFTQHWTPTPGPGSQSINFLGAGYDGATQLGLTPIVIGTIPPFGTSVYYTVGRETARNTVNTSIKNYVAAHPLTTTLADADLTLADPGTPANLNPAYDVGNGLYINDAGQTALVGLFGPLLP